MFDIFVVNHSEILRRQSSRAWLKNALFAQGLKKPSDKLSNVLLDLTASPSGAESGVSGAGPGVGVEAKSGFGLNTPADLLVRWLSLHDSTHQNFKVIIHFKNYLYALLEYFKFVLNHLSIKSYTAHGWRDYDPTRESSLCCSSLSWRVL
jgi:hypothetical protein